MLAAKRQSGRRVPMRIAILAAFAMGLALAGAASAQNGQSAGRIEIVQPWARATPGMAQTGAVYLTIRSPAADRLVSASSPVAEKAELHEMAMTGMVMKMRPLASVTIPAGHLVTFKPGGMHIMLVGLKAPLRPGQTFPLTLNFAKAGPETVSVTVGKIGAMAPPPAQH
jgi:periplasmic copper chaperone A